MTKRKHMQKSKRNFFIATTAFLLAVPFANAAPVFEITAAVSQPTLAASSSIALASPLADPVTLDEQATTPAATTANAQPADKPAAELSDWSMLLVGAGVLLLPRKRRVDNAVR